MFIVARGDAPGTLANRIELANGHIQPRRYGLVGQTPDVFSGFFSLIPGVMPLATLKKAVGHKTEMRNFKKRKRGILR